ncbi:cytochrome c-type biogenesis protein [Aurantivibrio infirmus]
MEKRIFTADRKFMNPIKFISLKVLLILVVAVAQAASAEDYYPFDNDDDRERFIRFSHDLRCPQCVSQNLAGSDADVAEDLKRELHRLITEDKTDQEIIEFMVSRYGEFVLYKPQFKATTYLLWLGPVALFVIALLVFISVLLKRQPDDDDE